MVNVVGLVGVMSPKTNKPTIGGRRAAAMAKRAAKAKSKGAPTSKRWARGVLEAPTDRIAEPPASSAAGASAQPSAIVEDDREGDEVIGSENKVGDDAVEASIDSDEPIRCDSRIIVPPHQVMPRDQLMNQAAWLGILPAAVEDAGHGSGVH